MKQYILLIICFCVFLPEIHSQKTLTDSLQYVLQSTTTPEDRLKAMTNLMDAAPKQALAFHAKRLYKEAKETNNCHYKEIALTELLRHYINNDIKDTVQLYLAEAERELEGKYKECMITYMKAIMDVRVVFYTETEEGKTILEQNLLKLKTQKNLSDIETMSANYILGMSLSNKVRPDDRDTHIKEMLSYFKVVATTGEKMPLAYRILFLPNTYFVICSNVSPEERSQYALRYLKLLTDYTTQNERPFTLKRQFLSAYTMLSGLAGTIGKDQATFYFNKFKEYNKLHPDAANVTPEYEYLSTAVEYYKSQKEYKKVIALNDSLITFFRSTPIFNRYVVLTMQENIALYDSLHMYKEAYETSKTCNILLDSARVQNAEDQLKDLEIQKNVNQLIIEKAALELEVEKQKAKVYLLMSLFLLSVSAMIFVIFRLGKIKSLYEELQESNRLVIIASGKAQESEKMKNAFIKNMCHEVRTPLNAINGFSELITSEDTSPEEKQEFSGIIFENCNHITSMMNSVLEIAQLDSNKENLPLEPTHIHSLCTSEMGQIKRLHMNPDIDYLIEEDPENDLAYTNRSHFSLIIAHLLNNANKFTKKGRIILTYKADKEQNQITVSVTDTGCGIEADKREWIFERFTKGNDFVPGSGLGLYLCREISLRMKACIWVDPDYTEGLRILLTLPIHPD